MRHLPLLLCRMHASLDMAKKNLVNGANIGPALLTVQDAQTELSQERENCRPTLNAQGRISAITLIPPMR